MDSTHDKKFLTTKSARLMSGYSADYLSLLARSGKVTAMRDGKSWLIDEVSLARFVEEQKVRNAEQAQSRARTFASSYEAHVAESASRKSVAVPATVNTLTAKVRQTVKDVSLTQIPVEWVSEVRAIAIAVLVVSGAAWAASTPVIPTIGGEVVRVATLASENAVDTFGSIPAHLKQQFIETQRTLARVSTPSAREFTLDELGSTLTNQLVAAHDSIALVTLTPRQSLAVAPADAQGEISLIALGDALARATAHVPSLAERGYLRVTAAPATLAPQVARAVVDTNYTFAHTFVTAMSAVTDTYLALVQNTGALAYVSTSGVREALASARAQVEDAYLGALGKGALALEQLSSAPTVANTLAAARFVASPTLGAGEQVALVTYHTIHGLFDSLTDTLAVFFTPLNTLAVIPQPTGAPLGVATRVAAQGASYASYPTYTTVVSGVTADALTQSLDALRAEVLGTSQDHDPYHVDSQWTSEDEYALSYSDGSVGIGTSTPSALFAVAGDGYLDGTLTAADLFANHTLTVLGDSTLATTTISSLTVSGDTTINGALTATTLSITGLSSTGAVTAPYFTATSTTASTFPYASTTVLSVSGSAYFPYGVWDSTGAVGVGTTTPTAKLSVFTSGTFPGGYNSNLDLEAVDYPALRLLSTANDKSVTIGGDSNGGLQIGVNGSTNGATTAYALSILSTGNVGIGSLVPQYKLDVAGLGRFTGLVDAANFVATSTTASRFPYASTTAITSSGSAYFATTDGSVGIGTTNPGTKLDVRGDARINTDAGFYASTGNPLYFGVDATPTNVGAIVPYGNNDNTYGLTFNTFNGSTLTEKVRIQGNGNVGIGTTTPGATLVVSKTTSANDNILTVNGLDNANLLNFQTSGTLGFTQYLSGGDLRFYSATAGDVFAIKKSNGNVGIGTTTPTSKLYVNGGPITIQNTGTGSSGGWLNFANASGNTKWHMSEYASGDLNFAETGVADGRLYLKAGGNVGIGATVPLARLDVRSANVALTNMSGNLLVANNETSQVAETGAQINLSGYLAGDPSVPYAHAAIRGVVESSVTNANGGALVLATMNSATTLVERMRINSLGSVGIGTTTPQVLLHLWKNVNGQMAQDIENQSSGANAYAELGLVNDAGALSRGTLYKTSSGYTGSEGANTLNLFNVSNNNLNFGTNNTIRVTVQNTGNVGIGTTSPSAKLVVADSASVGANIVSTGGAANLNLDTIGTSGLYSAQVGFKKAGAIKYALGAFNIGTGNQDDFSLYNYFTGSNVFTVASSTNNVGIGTINPVSKLTVEGNSGNIRLQTASDPTNYYAKLESNYNYGHPFNLSVAGGNPGSDPVELIGAYFGSDRATALMYGNVGIGTTTPGSKLEVETVGANNYITLNSGALSENGFLFDAVGAHRWELYSQTDGSNIDHFTLYNYRNASTVLTALNNGNVGIGTTTPAVKLDVYSTQSGASAMRIRQTSATGYGLAIIPGADTTYEAFYINNAADAVTNIGMFGNGSGYFKGSLAVGGTNPGKTLDVTGTGRFSSTLTLSGTVSCAGGQALQTNGSGDIACGTVSSGGSTSGGGWTSALGSVTLSTTTDRVGVGATSTPYAKLTVLSGAVGTTTLALVPASSQVANIIDIYNTSGVLSSVLTASGNFGLGTVSPAAKLHVVGSLFTTGTTVANRFENTFSSVPTGSAGVGLEMAVSGGTGVLQAYDRTGSAYSPIALQGSTVALQISGSTKLTVDTSGNVGIGTTTPNALLTISKTGNTYMNIVGTTQSGILISGSTGATAGTGYYIGRSLGAADGQDFFIYDQAAALARMVINSSGNVGIGTTTPSANLQISSSASPEFRIQTPLSSAVPDIAFYENATLSSYLQYRNSGAANPNIFQIGTGPVGSQIAFLTANTERMRIDSSGNVGIGTTSPVAKLAVAGSNVAVNLYVEGAGQFVGNDFGTSFQTLNNTQKRAQIFFKDSTGTITGRVGADISGTNDDDLQFIAGSGSTPMLHIEADGNVGIGTTTPQTLLHLQASAPALTLTPSAYTGSYQSYFGAESTAVGHLQLGNNGVNYIVGGNTNTGGYLQFVVNNTNSFPSTPNGTTAMTILSTGDIGIGTTSPATGRLLDVYSANGIAIARFESGANAGGNGIELVGKTSGGVTQTWQIAQALALTTADLEFRDATSLINVMTLQKGTGNVGIGTTSPSSLLHLSSSGNPELRISSTDTNGKTFALASEGGGTSALFSLIDRSAGVRRIAVDTLGRVALGGSWIGSGQLTRLFSVGSTTELFSITDTGNVGIGTTTPVNTLDIKANSSNDGALRLIQQNESRSSYTFKVDSLVNGALTLYSNYLGTDTGGFTQTRGGNVGIGTTTPTNGFAVHGTSYVSGTSFFGGAITATSTLTLGTLNGPLQANNGLISATTSIGILYGGTGLTSITGNRLLYSNNAGSALVEVATSSASFSIGGNANTATTLQTARTINGVSFNGSANITIASTTLLADSNTFSGSNLFSSSNTFSTAPTFSTALAITSGGTGATSLTANRLAYTNSAGSALTTVATSTLSSGTGITVSAGNGYLVGGSNATIALASISAGVLGSSVTGTPTSQATSTLYGTATGGQVLGWNNTTGGLAFIATSTDISGFTSGILSIARGGTNATSFTTSGNAVYYDGTRLVTAPTTAAVTTPYASTTALSATGSAYFATSGGNVGIGTTTPADKLDIAGGSLRMEGANTIKLYNSTNGNFATIGATSNSGVATADIAFSTGGVTNALNIANAGNVGVGTTSPSALLSVHGNQYTSGTAYFGGAITATSTLNVTGLTTLGNASTTQITSTGSAYFATTGGNVGIGTTTPQWLLNPSSASAAQLALSAGAGVAQWAFRNAGGNLYLATTSVAGTATSTLSALTIMSATGNVGISSSTPMSALGVAGNATFGGANIQIRLIGAPGAGDWVMQTVDADKRLRIFDNGNGAGERLTITSTGLVGIGTTTPAVKLVVAADGTNGSPQLALAGVSNPAKQMQVGYDTTSNYGYIQPLIQGSSYSNLILNSSGGSVGIGTTSPSNVLHTYTGSDGGGITNDGTTNPAITLASRNIARGFLGAVTATNGIIGGSVANDVALRVQGGNFLLSTDSGGTSAFTVKSTGNVGIGTTSPIGKLTVDGVTSYNNGLVIMGSDSTGTGLSIANTATGGHRYSILSGASGDAVGAGGFDIYDDTAGAHRFSILSGGNVGIGTTAPGAALDVKAAASTAFIAQLEGNASTGGYVSLYDAVNSTTRGYVGYGATLFTGADNTWYGLRSQSTLVFASNAAVSQRFMVMDTNGNVGIGTTTPVSKLHVLDVNQDLTSAAATVSIDSSSGQSANFGGSLLFGGLTTSTGGYAQFAGMRGVKENSTSANTAGALDFFTRSNGGALAQRVRIDSTGNLGIGTTSPATLLEVGGSTNNVTFDGYKNCTGFTSNGNGLVACTASDERLKQAITPLDGSAVLAGLTALNPVSFYWNPATGRGTTQQYGLIAQQVQSVFPNLVSMTNPTVLTPEGTLVVNYEGLISPMILAIKELNARISTTTMALTSLEARVAALESGAISSASSLSTSSLTSTLALLGVTIKNGFTQFGTLIADQFVAATNSAGQSSAGTVTILAGNTVAQVNNEYVLPSTKVFVTFNNSVTGNWYVDAKQAGSFRVVLSEAQGSDVSFDYFLVQTEGQIATATSTTGVAPSVTFPSAGGSSNSGGGAGTTTPPSSPPPPSGSGDTTPPVVTLVGDAAIQLTVGDTFTDAGATATDPATGSGQATDLTSAIVVTGSVDTATAGTYQLTYSATDGAGNTGSASRLVTVAAPPAP